MGEDAVIVEGIDHPESAKALYSTVHGAGRVLSRRQARGKTRIVRKWRCGELSQLRFRGRRRRVSPRPQQ